MDIENWIPKENISERKVYFDIPDEWQDPIKKLIEDILKIDSLIKFVQIKSKFGYLRVYVENENYEIEKLIDKCAAELGRARGNL